jgi:hypothetical protein
MERTIRILIEMREKYERDFINNSLIIMNTKEMDSPIPDTKSDLEMIEELNQAIGKLENYNVQKPFNWR